MKDNGSSTSKMINRNWVLKRKRRKLLCGLDLSNAKEENSVASKSPRSSPPVTKSLKGEKVCDRSSSKKKGNDGYYYECVICDLGGNLLCCDSCPGTYHLQCLDPPLKRIPMGKWKCPKCYLKNGPLKPISHLDSVSKRARTKTVHTKSQTGIRSSGSDRVSQIFDSSFLARKRSSCKGKSNSNQLIKPVEKELDLSQVDESSSPKLANTSLDGALEVDLTCKKVDDESIPSPSPADSNDNKKLISPHEEDLSEPKLTDAEKNDEPSEINTELPDNNESPRNKIILAIGAKKNKSKKRKSASSNQVSVKKHKNDKEECPTSTTKKRGSKTITLDHGMDKLPKKKRNVNSVALASVSKKDSGIKSMNKQKKDVKLPEENLHSSDKLDKVAGHAVEVLRHEENVSNELLQVDRVLGCRIQSDSGSSSGHIPMMVADNMSFDLLGPENLNRNQEETSACDIDMDVRVSENHINVCSDNEECVKDDDEVEKVLLEARKGEGGRSMSLLLKDEKDSDSNVLDSKDRDESALTTDGSEKKDEKKSADVSLGSYGANAVTEVCEIPTSDEPILGKKTDKETHLSGDFQNKLQEPSGAKLAVACPSEKTTSFEYLVKWAGKSNLHNSWISESVLKVLAKRKLENYKAKYGTTLINICEEKWKQPQRIISLRDSVDGTREALVKWTSLPYDDCTWERVDEPVLMEHSGLKDIFDQFEHQTLKNNAAKDDLKRGKGNNQQVEVVTLTEQPKELKGGSLFPHQLEALNWLRKCWHKSKNVILADEMGLGKTVSACAFLSALYFEFKVTLPCLVLVPLSTMPNWLAEFSLWAPHLNVVEYHGCAKARTMIRQYEWHASDPNELNKKTTSYKFNVILTTYEMILADSSYLRGVPWEVLVVDEGHRLKNSESKLFNLLNTYSFQHRVLLTGTPLQNNIGEMYNLLNFLQPSSFPSLSSFEENFTDLTTAEKVDELKKLVAPHMLRRLKRDAMQNIPPKTERIVPVELSSIQAEYYRAMLTKNYQILRNIGKGVAQQSMLNVVMQLRKVCNHPYLIQGTEPESGSLEFLHEMRIKASAKLTLLHSMLKVLYKEGHRVLIFSQMTKLLDILEDYLNIEFGPKTYERVDGSVSVADRQIAISRFNQDKGRFVFLLSTRSCGLGINLASADTVIIYDSDFNPHADIQAMNRAHRIGQSKRLLVYRLVVRASVEERILQLAKKKLMLDQLFVNKSGSQKEVEDILRWGTEELFIDSPSVNGKDTGETDCQKDEVVIDVEHKHRRRVGGLGDVYKDKCTDGSSKVVWDEAAILKLLDRSNLQFGYGDNAEGVSENDMLGAVKSLEWNDETTEEQGPESPPLVNDDNIAQNSERKEDNVVNVTEENEWDKLLRVRWEKYQSEEEAVLGRGKRLRKAISYREAYAPQQSEVLSESAGEEEKEREPEPQKEYTPAGRALKVKYAKLRARQKERLARRKANEEFIRSGLLPGPESFNESAAGKRDVNQATESVQQVGEKFLTNDLEDHKFTHSIDAPKCMADSTLRLGRLIKHKAGRHVDLSASPLAIQSSDNTLQTQHLKGAGHANFLSTNNMLPVLGLCAPNASQPHRIFSKSNGRQNRSGTGPEFPFSLAPISTASFGTAMKVQDTSSGNLNSQDAPPAEVMQHFNNKDADNWFPFNPYPPVARHGISSDHFERSSVKFAEFQERMSLHNFPFNESFLPRLPNRAKSMTTSHNDLLPNPSMMSRHEGTNDPIPDLLAMPLLPNLKFSSQDDPRYNQQDREIPPTLGLGRLSSPFSSFPENHRKVLENIMMRTSPGSSGMLKRKSNVDGWSEDELDFLWIGVRRHGKGNWDGMVMDPRLKFSRYKTPDDLAARWEEEQLKLFEGSSLSHVKPSKFKKSTKSPVFPSIPEGMMARALNGSKLPASTNFQPHLTDMKLGFGDLASTMPPFEPYDQLSLRNEQFAPGHSWSVDKFNRNFTGDSSAGPSDRPGTSTNASTEKPFFLNSLGTSNLCSVSLNCSNTLDIQRREEERRSIKYGKLPTLLDRPLPDLFDLQTTLRRGESTSSGLLPDPNKVLNHSHSKGKEVVGSNSSDNKLPHWLREAVSAPAKLPDPTLPPTVSAIAQSVRVLYGEDKSTIPPFVVPGPPLHKPKDPRCNLKKKKKQKSYTPMQPPDVAGSRQNSPSYIQGNNSSSNPTPSGSVNGISRPSSVETGEVLPPHSATTMNQSTSNANQVTPKKTSTELSPSPEVVELVASSCVAPGPPCMPSDSCMTNNSSILKNNIPLPRSDDDEPGCSESQVAIENVKHIENSSLENATQDHEDKDSGKNPEASSEGTVSDHSMSDHEQEELCNP